MYADVDHLISLVLLRTSKWLTPKQLTITPPASSLLNFCDSLGVRYVTWQRMHTSEPRVEWRKEACTTGREQTQLSLSLSLSVTA